MERIDHYPQVQSNDDLHAGRVAGEIRALREQQENIYFRDIERSFEQSEEKKKKKNKNEESIEEFRGLNKFDLNANLIGSVDDLDGLDRDSTNAKVTIIAILIFTFLIAFATYSLTH